MLLATLTISSRQWLWPAVAGALVSLLLVVWSYRGGASTWTRWSCGALKFLGLSALLACLLEPLWSGQRARPGANLFAVVADNSQGLQVKDQGEKQSRGDILQSWLGAEGATWQAALEENYDVRRFYFDTRLQATRDFHELDFQGRTTALGSALRGLKERFEGRPLAGILLLTDGNATDFTELPPDIKGLPPIYPVVVGRRSDLCDVAIAQVNVSQSSFEDAPITVQADVSAFGVSGESVLARLLDATGKRLQESSQRARKQESTLAFRFQFRPPNPGVSFYRVVVGLQSELARTNQPQASSREATLLNNSRVVAVDRGQGPFRVLYVGGRPNWEYKFFNRAIQEDREVQLVTLIRIANREPKFDFRGRGGETSNPLFRGFANQSREEAEHYDQPVLIRLNTRDELELRGGFPTKPEELFGYQAVILDDVEAGFFTADQQAVLQRFVSERGGGLLMLGGMECFQQGKYQRTPIGDMLPVYLDNTSVGQSPGPVRLSLGPEGWLQPWARVRELETDEKARLESMPGFKVINGSHGIKPAASVIAEAADNAGRQYPALVTQRFGRGRTAAFLIGDFWRWGMQNPSARADMEKSWRQLVRWLIADVPKPVELTIEPGAEPASGAVALQVRARDAKFQPLDDSSVSIEVRPVTVADTNDTSRALVLRAEPSLKEPGLYEATYVPRGTGGFIARASATNSAGLAVGQAAAGWATDLAAEEFRSLQPNVRLLEELAQRTGGAVITADKLSSFARQLPRKTAPVMEAWTTPAWHTPLVFGFALVCLVAEWGLRRWKGLP